MKIRCIQWKVSQVFFLHGSGGFYFFGSSWKFAGNWPYSTHSWSIFQPTMLPYREFCRVWHQLSVAISLWVDIFLKQPLPEISVWQNGEVWGLCVRILEPLKHRLSGKWKGPKKKHHIKKRWKCACSRIHGKQAHPHQKRSRPPYIAHNICAPLIVGVILGLGPFDFVGLDT